MFGNLNGFTAHTIVYVMDGRRIWHMAQGCFELQKGSSVFVRKGASLVEYFNDSAFCVIVFLYRMIFFARY
ncbi:hypothetical protein [Paraflavitalea speifideaquila]|uniref:hypothetical protein n=1 Tax=Paraflavitalea speifideaquila TaxID=3076558 RepID=UPI0028E8B967|nr:hypothetical protein [Paraflavitalea speifideiaquila]